MLDAPPARPEAAATADVRPDAGAAVVIDGATKRFGDDTAVDGISLSVPSGTILGIIGPSGSGKTTTIRLLTGALAPTDGQVRVLGEDPRTFRRQTRERIGYMPQQFTLYPDLTARENVDFVASLFGVMFRTRHRRTREVLQLVDLWDAAAAAPVACRVGCSDDWSSLRHSSTIPTCCSSTNLPPESTRSCGPPSGKSSIACAMTVGRSS